MSRSVKENDVVRLVREVDGWPVGTEGTAVVAIGNRLSIEPDIGVGSTDFIEAVTDDVEVIWTMGDPIVDEPTPQRHLRAVA